MAPIQQTVHRNWIFLLLVTLLLFLPVTIRAEMPGAEELFQKVLNSLKTVDYKGKLTFISMVPDEHPVREAVVIREAPDKQSIEFVQPDEMRGMGMVMNKDERWRLRGERPRGRRPFLSPPPNRMMEQLPLRNIQILLRNHDVRVLNGGSVAGRDTYLIELEPKMPNRPSKKFWIDVEMGVLLKVEDYDFQRRLKNVFAFSDIDFEPEIDEATFRKRQKPDERRGPRKGPEREELWSYGKGKLDLNEVRKTAKLDVIMPEQPPAGFDLQSIQVMSVGRRRNVHLSYTNGLTILSVFQSPDGEDHRRPPEDRPPWPGIKAEKANISGVECEIMSGGGMLIYRWNHKDLQLTLMGELGKEEMTGIVGSFISEVK